MVEKRRTMAQALELNPEKLAFIHGVPRTDQGKPDSTDESMDWNDPSHAADNRKSRTEASEPTIVRPRSRERTLQSSQDPQRRPMEIPRKNYDEDNFNEVLVPLPAGNRHLWRGDDCTEGRFVVAMGDVATTMGQAKRIPIGVAWRSPQIS